jgi:hypothetical protein
MTDPDIPAFSSGTDPDSGGGGPVAPHDGDHSAAASALGYGAQIEHGLLTLLEFAFREPASLTLEVFDDIETLTGRERKYIQIKNKPGTVRSLTDASEDVWASVDNWRSAWLERSTDEAQRFCLVTTQTAAANSALAMLRPLAPDRSPDDAAHRLDRAAHESRNKATEAARQGFLALSRAEQEAFLRCVEVYDGSEDASHVQHQLLTHPKLRAITDPPYVASLVKHLRGWWAQRSLIHLHQVAAGEVDRITTDELEEQIHDARRQHADRALPVYDTDTLSEEDLRPESDDDVYLHQLRVIDAPPPRQESARLNYQRAYAHRSLWGRRGLITDVELQRFETGLIEEWQLRRDELSLTPCTTETEEKQRGLALLTNVEIHVRLPLRAELHQPFVQRGTYHSLADRRRLGWHPRWEQLVGHGAPDADGGP